MCGGFALGDPAVVSPEKKVGMLVHVSVIEVKFSKAGDVIENVIEEVKLRPV